jgi:hypothetical protein
MTGARVKHQVPTEIWSHKQLMFSKWAVAQS